MLGTGTTLRVPLKCRQTAPRWGTRGIATVVAALAGLACDSGDSTGNAPASSLGGVCIRRLEGEVVQCSERYNNGELDDAEAEELTNAFLSYGCGEVADGPCPVGPRPLGVCTIDDPTSEPTLGMREHYYVDPASEEPETTQMLATEHSCYQTFALDDPKAVPTAVFERAPHFPMETTTGPMTGILALAHGSGHACVVRDDESVWCWGDNQDGELGMGVVDSAPHSWPHPVPDLVGVIDVVSNPGVTGATCALRSEGTVVCWGGNRFGQVDAGSSDEIIASPVAIEGVSSAVEIEMSRTSVCTRSSADEVTCWGGGQGPHTVPELAGATAIYPQYVRLGDGSLVKWDGTAADLPPNAEPADSSCYVLSGEAWCLEVDGDVRIEFPQEVTFVNQNIFGQCALLVDDTLWCRNSGNLSEPSEAMQILDDVQSIEGGNGDGSACALLNDATVACWGTNGFGELGRRGAGRPYGGEPGVVFR